MALSFFRQQPRIVAHGRNRALTGPYPAELESLLPRGMFAEALNDVRNWPGYEPTPLRELDRLAATLGLESLLYKDESHRFGFSSFKPLGGTYAVIRLLADALGMTTMAVSYGEAREQLAEVIITTATDGNIGQAVAWGAREAGCRCIVYIHRGVSEGRARAMTDLGAKVVRVEGDYNDSVHQCARDSARNGWLMVTDTAFQDRPEVPLHVMAGYATIASEVLEQVRAPITHVFVPVGGGGLAAALAARFWMEMGARRPRFVCVESEYSACFLRSVRRGALAPVKIRQETVMAGISCGLPSPEAWEILRRAASDFVTIGDGAVAAAIRMLASGQAGGGGIEAGECSAAAPLALIAAACDEGLREALGLDASSRVLLIGTEGATDREIYDRLMTEEA